jgi:hypothetical protein
VRALAELRDADALEAFARSKRSPIGYEPFVRALLARGLPREATAFVPRCDPPRRAALYVDCGDWRAAGRECKERGDRARLECVPAAAPRPPRAIRADGRAQGVAADVPEHADRARAGSDSRYHEMMMMIPGAFPAFATALPEPPVVSLRKVGVA